MKYTDERDGIVKSVGRWLAPAALCNSELHLWDKMPSSPAIILQRGYLQQTKKHGFTLNGIGRALLYFLL